GRVSPSLPTRGCLHAPPAAAGPSLHRTGLRHGVSGVPAQRQQVPPDDPISALSDDGHDDEAKSVAAVWPAIADSVLLGSMTLGECLSLLARHIPGLTRLAGRLRV